MQIINLEIPPNVQHMLTCMFSHLSSIWYIKAWVLDALSTNFMPNIYGKSMNASLYTIYTNYTPNTLIL